jgi:hypothetical protein
MVPRRDLVSGGLVAGLAGLMASPAAAAAAGAEAPATDLESAAAINRLRETVERQFEQVYSGKWRGVSRVRQQQRTWMVSTRKYPDFLEIGLDVWDNVYDWHVTFQQPLNVTRLADGRYVMAFQFTTLLLRPDQAPDFIGYPFDADSPNRTR